MAAVTVLQSNKGGVKLLLNDYEYCKVRESRNGIIVWKCCHCPARLRTHGPPNYAEPVVSGVHNHQSNPLRTQVLLCRQDMKQRMQNHPELVSTAVYREKLLEVPLEVVALLPNKETVGRALRAERSKLRPPLPAMAADLQLALYQTVTGNNERFLLVDEIHEGERILIFVTDYFLNLLCNATLVFGDGTFRTVPHIFVQLFTVNFMYNDKLIPAVYALVRRKTQATYEFILRAIRTAASDRGLQFQPQHFMTDFESGLMSAIAVQLPGTQQRGCFFHFCQCCYRHVQSLGFQQTYRDNDAHRILIRVTMALAFLPSHEIVPTFNKYRDLIRVHMPILMPFMEYFCRQWIVSVSPEVWCVHGHAIRTNNDLEGWHFSMKRSLLKDHPDIHSFLKWLKDEETMSRIVITQIDAGNLQPSRKNARYVNISRKLEDLRLAYLAGTRSRSQFLRSCSYSLAQMRAPQVEAAVEMEAVVGQDAQVPDVHGVIPWQELDRIIEVDLPVIPNRLWQPWM